MLLGAACVALSASTVLAAKWPRALNGKSLSERYLSEARFSDHATYETLHDASGTRMSGVPGRVLGTVWLYVLVWFLIMDAAKYVLYYLLQRYTALRHTQDPKRPAGPCRECETQQGSFCSIETADQQQPGWELRSGDTAFPPRPLPTT
jgi:hypothetical protein